MPILALAASLLVAGCGGGDSSKDSGGSKGAGETLELSTVKGELEFDKTELEAEAGTITLKFTNPDQIPHNVAMEVDGKAEEGELVSNGEVSKITVDLEPGTYEYYCSPHEGAGMKGELTVT